VAPVHEQTKKWLMNTLGCLAFAAIYVAGVQAAEQNPIKPVLHGKKSEGFFSGPSNGAAAAVAGAANLGFYVGALAAGPSDWQGYPKGGQGMGMDGAFEGALPAQTGQNCALSGFSQLAKALTTPEGALEPPKENGRLTTLQPLGLQKPSEIGDAYDSRDLYQSGVPVTCAP
jgi:hypothetical protein